MTVSQAIKTLRNEHKAWDESQYPGDSWWKAVDGVIETIGAATLTDAQLSLCEPVADMIDSRFREEDDKPGPSRDLLAAIGRVLEWQPRVWPELETIKQLDKEKVRHSQIATMHGLTVGQVQRIIEGEEKYPADHITPHEQAQRRAKRLLRDRMRLAFNRYQSLKQIAEIETVGDYIEDGMTLGEIADEFDAEPEAVLLEAKSAGFVPDGSGMTLDEQILSMSDQGVENSEIAETLGVSVQKVAGAIRRSQTPPETIARRKVRKKVLDARSRQS